MLVLSPLPVGSRVFELFLGMVGVFVYLILLLGWRGGGSFRVSRVILMFFAFKKFMVAPLKSVGSFSFGFPIGSYVFLDLLIPRGFKIQLQEGLLFALGLVSLEAQSHRLFLRLGVAILLLLFLQAATRLM